MKENQHNVNVFKNYLSYAIWLHYVENQSYAAMTNTFVTFIKTCWKPSVCIYDADSSLWAVWKYDKLAYVHSFN